MKGLSSSNKQLCEAATVCAVDLFKAGSFVADKSSSFFRYFVSQVQGQLHVRTVSIVQCSCLCIIIHVPITLTIPTEIWLIHVHVHVCVCVHTYKDCILSFYTCMCSLKLYKLIFSRTYSLPHPMHTGTESAVLSTKPVPPPAIQPSSWHPHLH